MKLKVGGGAGLLRLTDKHCLLDTVSPTGGVDGLGLCTLPKSRSEPPNGNCGVTLEPMVKLKVGGGAGLLRLTDERCVQVSVLPPSEVDESLLLIVPRSWPEPLREGRAVLDASELEVPKQNCDGVVGGRTASRLKSR